MKKVKKHVEKQNKVMRTAAQTAVLMAILTLGSKGIGFIREMIMAGFFGTSYIVDAYVMAQSIPEIIFIGIFGAVAISFMPMFSNKIEKEGDKAGDIFTSQVIKILLVLSFFSALLGLFFSDQLTHIFAKGFTGKTEELTSMFLKISFSYVIFSSTAGIFEAYLQYKKVFLPQIVIGYTQSTIVIIAIIISAYTSYYYLAFGLLFAYAVRLLLMWMLSRRLGFRYEKHTENIKAVLKDITALALPVFVGSSAYQINLFVDKYLASGLQEGSVSALSYANILNTMIMSVTVSILTTMIYPRLAQANAVNDSNRFSDLIQKGVNLTILIAFPFSLGAIIYSEQIVQIIFERGAFDLVATSLTGSAYLCYSVGMLFMALNSLLTRVYYSLHDMKTPVIFAFMSVIINTTISLTLIGTMHHNGLALATSIAAIVNSILLYIGLRKKHRNIKIIENWKKILIMVITSIVSLGISYIVFIFLSSTIWMPRLVYLGIAVLVAIIVYIILLWVYKMEEIGIIRSLIKK